LRINISIPKKLINLAKIVFVGYNIMAMSGSVVDDTDMDDMAMAYNNTVRFDTDSYPIKIDNCCTQTTMGYKADFIPNTMVSINGKHVTGFSKTQTKISHIGTVRWKVSDDQGIDHDITIPNTYYVPGCGIRLLSPQHWAQEAMDNIPCKDGTWCATYSN
jgi:hypothetical protein